MRGSRRLFQVLLSAAALLAATAFAQPQGDSGITRLLVTDAHGKPDRAAEWRALQRDQVIPALKKAGIQQYIVYETLVGDTSAFVIVRPLLFVSRYRAMPGKARDYMNFVRAEMMPPMRQAQQNDTFAGLSVTVSVQGGEPGIITLNMFYDDFAPLDGPPPIAKTLGPEGTAAFLVKGAGLIDQLDQSILRRRPEQSF